MDATVGRAENRLSFGFLTPQQRPKNMVRCVLGIVAGAIAWMACFWVFVIVLATLWPDYGHHGRTWMTEQVFTFTPLMACFNLLFWALAEMGAGWTPSATRTARTADAPA
jgi:hypothetical protein